MQTAEERYEYGWQDYQASQERGLYKTLKSYCQAHHINYEGMRYWKRKNVQQPKRAQSSPKADTPPEGGFVTIVPESCTPSATSTLTDVQLSLPSGLAIHIGSLPAEVLLSILSTQKVM